MHTVQSVSIGRYIELQSNVKLFNAARALLVCIRWAMHAHTYRTHLRLYWIFFVHCTNRIYFDFYKENSRGEISLCWKTDLIWIQHGTSSSLHITTYIVVMRTAECISKHIENEREKLDLTTAERTFLTNTAYITSITRTNSGEYIKIIIIINWWYTNNNKYYEVKCCVA